MTTNGFERILRLLQHESHDATYKFALLRGMIDVIEQAPFRFSGCDLKNGVFPLGLLVERWIYYYFPLIQKQIPRQAGDKSNNGQYIAFRRQLEKAIAHYATDDPFSSFHHDYQYKRITGAAARDFLTAACKIAETVANMPMRNLGQSGAKGEFTVVKPSMMKFSTLRSDCFDGDFLTASFGTYKISPDYLGPLKQLGSILVGTGSILWQWAEFTARIRGNDVDAPEVLRILNTRPSDERDVVSVRQLYLSILEKGGELPCVWCGKPIASAQELAVDHVIPFSLWGDHSLPNLMPCHVKENIAKGDRIPSPDLIRSAAPRLRHYLFLLQPPQMQNKGVSPSMRSTHSGQGSKKSNMFDRPTSGPENGSAYSSFDVEPWVSALAEKCRGLIVDRGFASYK